MIIRNVDIWNPDGVLESRDIHLNGHHIEKIAETSARSSKKIQKLCLLPAGVDAQVHLRVPGQEQKEDAKTGLMAALCGGYGAILTMPNTKPVIDCVEVVRLAQEKVFEVSENLGIQVLISAAATLEQKGEKRSSLRNLFEAGVAAITDDGLGVESDELMGEIFKELEDIPIPFLQHAEFRGHGGVLAPGSVQKSLGVQPYFEDVEIKMLERDLNLLKRYPKARYHLLHCTSAKAIPLIRRAKEQGLQVTAEVSPHHLFFNSEQIDPENSSFKMNPPIRSEKDQEELQKALFEGCFDFVATDHAPHQQTEKTTDFSKALFGTLGLETALPVLLFFYQNKKLSSKRLVEVFSTRPAKFLGIEKDFGKIEEGKLLRAVVINPEAPLKKFDSSQLHSKSKNSCFNGVELPDAIYGHYTSKGYFAFKEGLVCESE